MRLSNSKAPSKGKRYLLTSYNVNDVTERPPRDNYGNVTLMAQRAKQDFILQLNLLCSNRVSLSTTTPILIPDRELGNNVNLTSKKFFFFFFYFLCSGKKPWKSGRKTIHHEPVNVG